MDRYIARCRLNLARHEPIHREVSREHRGVSAEPRETWAHAALAAADAAVDIADVALDVADAALCVVTLRSRSRMVTREAAESASPWATASGV